MTKTVKPISTEEFDKKFDDGEDIMPYIKKESFSRKVLLDIPCHVLDGLDEEAMKIGISRTALIKVWLK